MLTLSLLVIVVITVGFFGEKSIMAAKGTTTQEHDEKIARMLFSSVYPLYLNKILKKGRSEKIATTSHYLADWFRR